MHDPGVKLYRQRMRREHPQVDGSELDALVRTWLAEPPRSGRPRFTKDLDFAIAVADDSEAEDIVHKLRSRDYHPVEALEQDYVERLSGVRLACAGSDELDAARNAVKLIQERGFNRQQDVVADLDQLVADLGR
jgi:hypothetical protein